jgi:hypothetical protein
MDIVDRVLAPLPDEQRHVIDIGMKNVLFHNKILIFSPLRLWIGELVCEFTLDSTYFIDGLMKVF